MIRKFSTAYAGHVDLGDMGQMATPANERRYSNEHLASVFEKTEAIARCMDEPTGSSSRSRTQGPDPGAAPTAAAGGALTTRGERQRAGARLHG